MVAHEHPHLLESLGELHAGLAAAEGGHAAQPIRSHVGLAGLVPVAMHGGDLRRQVGADVDEGGRRELAGHRGGFEAQDGGRTARGAHDRIVHSGVVLMRIVVRVGEDDVGLDAPERVFDGEHHLVRVFGQTRVGVVEDVDVDESHRVSPGDRLMDPSLGIAASRPVAHHQAVNVRALGGPPRQGPAGGQLEVIRMRADGDDPQRGRRSSFGGHAANPHETEADEDQRHHERRAVQCDRGRVARAVGEFDEQVQNGDDQQRSRDETTASRSLPVPVGTSERACSENDHRTGGGDDGIDDVHGVTPSPRGRLRTNSPSGPLPSVAPQADSMRPDVRRDNGW